MSLLSLNYRIVSYLSDGYDNTCLPILLPAPIGVINLVYHTFLRLIIKVNNKSSKNHSNSNKQKISRAIVDAVAPYTATSNRDRGRRLTRWARS